MPVVAYDTLDTFQKLKDAGITEALAKAIVEAVRPTTPLPDISNLATKDELRNAVVEVKAEIKAQKGELIWWIIGSGVVSTIAHYFLK